jgi:hypothetical protein
MLKGLRWAEEGDSDADAGVFSLPPAGRGRFKALVLDMGETVVGPVSLAVSGGHSGEVLDLLFFEMLDGQCGPVIPFPAFCEVSLANRLVLRTGETDCDFFHLLGFRYILVSAHESMSEISVRLVVNDTGYPYRETGGFTCSDPLLNDIWKVCRRTEEVCSLDTYVDTPWREQTQWWGDCNVQFRNTLTMDWDPRLMKRGLESIIRQRVPNGLTYGHAPTMAHQCILPDYSLSWLVFLYDYWSRTGDLSVFLNHQVEIEGILGYFVSEAPRYRGLLAFDRRYWLFLDWSNLQKDGAPTLFSMWYLHTLRLTAVMFHRAGQDGKAKELELQAETMKQRIETLSFDAGEGLFHDGYNAAGEKLTTRSVHVQTMAMMLDIMPEYHKTMLEKSLVPYLRGLSVGGPRPSAYWATYVLSVAREHGFQALVLDFIKRKWQPMVAHGTTFEVFGPEEKIVTEDHFESINADWGNFSASHAWTAHPMFHLTEMLGGVTEVPEDQGIVNFRPWFSPGLTMVDVAVPHSRGIIHASWRRTGKNIVVKLSLPSGVQARVGIPNHEGIVEGSVGWELADLVPDRE